MGRQRAAGLRTDIGLELTARTVANRSWTIAIREDSIRVHAGAPADTALTVRLPLATFVAVLSGRAPLSDLATSPAVDAEGDLTLLQRVGDLLRAPSPY